MKSLKEARLDSFHNEQFETLRRSQLFKMHGGNEVISVIPGNSGGNSVGNFMPGNFETITDGTPTDNGSDMKNRMTHVYTGGNYWGYCIMDESSCG